MHLHVLFNIGFTFNGKLFEAFRPPEPCLFSVNHVHVLTIVDFWKVTRSILETDMFGRT